MQRRALNIEEAIPYLLQHGLLQEGDLLRADVRVTSEARRNLNLRIERTRPPSFFLKQPDPSEPSTFNSLGREATCYAYFARAASRSLQRLAPRFVRYDASRHILLVEFLRSAVPLSQFLVTRSSKPRRAAAMALARALAVCRKARIPALFPGIGARGPEVPWALRFVFPGPALLRTATLGQLEVIRLVQRDPEVHDRLEALGLEYTGHCLVHGDLRWQNVLVEAAVSRTPMRLRFIDWELAHKGDEAWDVGTTFASFLAHCISSMDPGTAVTPRSLRHAFADRLPSVRIEIRAFWTAFIRGVGLGPLSWRPLLDRATQYCGARLLQSAFEWSPGDTLSPIAACFLQVGLNILRRPPEATRMLLGIARG